MTFPETVFLVDDDQPLLVATKDLLESSGWHVETFSSPFDFLARYQKSDGPGCLLLDVRLGGMSGLQLQRDLHALKVEIPIIFVTGHADVRMGVEAMKAGAVDFLTKPFRDQDLLDAVSKGIERDRRQRQLKQESIDLRERYDSLTAREREVMELVVSGLLNKQIAAQLTMSETTAKIHRANMIRKMRAQSLPDLVRITEKLNLPVRKC